MSLELLDKTRKINKLLHNNNSHKVVFNDICEVLSNILLSNVLVISRKGKVLGIKNRQDIEVIDELINNEVGGYIDTLLNERLLGVLSTKENVNLETLGFEHTEIDRYQAIITPIDIAGERLGTVFMYRKEHHYEIDDIILVEYGTTVVGLEMMRSVNEENAEETRKEAIELQKLCRRYNIPFVVNDSVEIALEMDADGVHVGQSDIKERDIRAMIGPDKILGMTAKTVEQAIAAEKAGADYIGTGAVFGSTTKKDAKYLSMEDLKKIAASVSIPVVAIGGINSENVSQLEGSGVNGAAVISGIFAAEDPAAKTAQMSRLTDIFC